LSAILALQVTWAQHAIAQDTATSPSKPPPAAERPPPKDPEAELVEQLMTSEEDRDEDDLGWLFSSADEYSPSTLTGKPLPAPALPQRGEGSPRTWDPRWRKFGTGHYVLTGASIVTAAASIAIPPVPSRWRTRNRLDEWGRRNVAIQDYEEGLWARDLSDVLVSVNVTYPVLVDSLIVTYWYRQSEQVAAQMALITLEALAVSAALQGLTSGIASRERPFVRDCGGSIDARLDDCLERDRFRSFFSGHSSNAFAAASVTCSHHMRHEVFGDPIADGLACGVAYASASTVALMRVVGQRHFISDVITGASIGTLSGLGVPWLLHYGPLARRDTATAARVQWSLLPMPNGIALGGKF
jgi:hypothetical protein